MYRNIHTICMYDYFGFCFKYNLYFIDHDINIVYKQKYLH